MKLKKTHIRKMITQLFVATVLLSGIISPDIALSASMPNTADGVLIGRYSCDWDNYGDSTYMYSEIKFDSTGDITPQDFNIGTNRITSSTDCVSDATPVRQLAIDLGCTPNNLNTWADETWGGSNFSFLCKATHKEIINIIAEMGKAILQTTSSASNSQKEADKK